MTSFDYSGLVSVAERLLARFGRTATLHSVTISGDEWSPSISTADTEITVVDSKQKIRNQDLVEKGARMLMVSTSAGVTPKEKDSITVDGVEHQVAEVETIAPSGVVLIWKVIIVQG